MVLGSTCGTSFTYRIDGPEATYVGPGDQHDPQYDDLSSSDLIIGDPNEKRPLHCAYNVSIYPTSTLEEKYTTNEPLFYAVGLLATFLFTSIVFVVYDCSVRRRHTLVSKTAIESSAVVSSLFPTNVRDRMVNYAAETDKDREAQKESFLSENNVANSNAPIADLYPNCSVLVSRQMWLSVTFLSEHVSEICCFVVCGSGGFYELEFQSVSV